jgi:signal transduction histidine kinase
VTVALALDEKLPRAPMDEKAARRAIANVIKNAHEAVDDPGGRVDIRTGASAGGVWLSVTDNGPGIPEEKRRRMFEEFTTKVDGSGLGMLVVRKVMDQHGGRVDIESSPRRGTTVTLFFPTHIHA